MEEVTTERSRAGCDVFITKSNSVQNNRSCVAERSSDVDKLLICVILSITFVCEEYLDDEIHSMGARRSSGDLSQSGL